jgi:putative addiction module component (TIGR02574 family)
LLRTPFIPTLGGMSTLPSLEDILRLPADQRLRLVEEIWDSLVALPQDVPVPDWHRQLLDERLDSGERASRSWEQVRENARRPRD